MKKEKFYAYATDKRKGVADNWPECRQIVSGVPNAKFKAFTTKTEAQKWLSAGADYGRERQIAEKGVYFDAGTGRGRGVEISVTDEKGNNLLNQILPTNKINQWGKHLILKDVTNNFGELLACKYALKIALKEKVKKVFGDSKLVIDYWSKGFANKKNIAPKTIKIIEEVKKIREEFEKRGGKIKLVSGTNNPADLGFHK